MTRWLAKLHDLNPRWLYLATAVLLLVPLVTMIPMPRSGISRAVQGLYDTIEACPTDGIVLVDSSWDMGSRSENMAQLACVVRHLCRRKIRFVVISTVTPFCPEFAGQVIEPIAKEAGYVYGRDWTNMGYIQANTGLAVVIEGLARDFHKMRQADVHGTPVDQLPLMQHVRSIKDLDLVYSVTYSPSPEWISFVKGQFGTPVAFGCMSIMAPSYYAYIDSGQLSGMLAGNRGAAEYEALLGRPDQGTRLSMAATFGNAAVILAALVGNLGLWAALRMRGRAA